MALSALRMLSNQDAHGLVTVALRAKTTADGRIAVYVAFADPAAPVGSVDAVLNAILRHISADILPRFEALSSSPE
jgi:hypothetical protein